MRLAQLCPVFFILAVCSYEGIAAPAAAPVKEYRVKVVSRVAHDRNAYTQGLFFHGGALYESDGQYGESAFRKLDAGSGKVLEELSFPAKFFAEGACIAGGRFYILTWRENVCWVYDAASGNKVTEFYNPQEGWGVTFDGRTLVTSDGTSYLRKRDPFSFAEMSKVQVTMGGRPVQFLNELEYIGGKVWANVYTSDYIVIINPDTGVVEGRIDCGGLLPDSERRADTDVLNGIAVNPADGSIWLTGKNWPALFKVEIIEK